MRCGAEMRSSRVEPVSTVGVTFTRETFKCGRCGHTQTYTQGSAGKAET